MTVAKATNKDKTGIAKDRSWWRSPQPQFLVLNGAYTHWHFKIRGVFLWGFAPLPIYRTMIGGWQTGEPQCECSGEPFANPTDTVILAN